MLQAVVDYLIENQVGIIPRYVRIGRNVSRDHLSRTDGEGIRHWGLCNHIKRVSVPSVWNAFCEQWKPEVDFNTNGAMGIRLSLQEHGRNLVCCAWRPSCYTFAACVRRYQGRCYVHEPGHADVQKQMGECPDWNGHYLDLLRGLVWDDVEINDFSHAANHLRPNASAAITPNALLDPVSRPRQRDDCILGDSASFGSVRNQKWRLYIWGNIPQEFMQVTPMYRESRTLLDAYRLEGVSPMDGEIGAVRIIPFGCVKGLTVFIEGIGGVGKYSLASHMPTLSMNTIRSGEPKRPKKKENGKEATKKGKIAILGGRPNWIKIKNISDNATAITLYQSGPMEIMERALLRSFIVKGGDTKLQNPRRPSGSDYVPTGRAGGVESNQHMGTFGRMPEVAQGELRNAVAGDDLLANANEVPTNEESDVLSFFKEKAQYVSGSGALEDLMAGIAKSTRASYIAARKRWYQFTLRTPNRSWVAQVDP